MNQPDALEFVLIGDAAGQPMSATKGVPFTRFAEFNDEVQKYVQGSDSKSVLRDITVQVRDGSYLLRVLIPVGLLSSLLTDTAKIAQSAPLNEIDPNRARVVLRWQERAKTDPSVRFSIRSPRGAFAPVEITKDTTLQKEQRIQWVNVERYLVGQITDWGGAQTPNVHLRPRNSRETIIVDATEEQIRAQRENLVFHKAIVHVRAKQNPKTGEIDRESYKLIELRAYQPDVADERLESCSTAGPRLGPEFRKVAPGSRSSEEARMADGVCSTRVS